MKRERKESKDERPGTGIAEMILIPVVLILLVLVFKPQILEFAAMVCERTIGQHGFSDKFNFSGGMV